MKKIRKLLAVAFCSAWLIVGIQLRAVAQQTQESPRDLGRNAGTGETRLPEGTWELVRIEATQEPFLTLITRQKKGFFVDTREVKGVRLGMDDPKWDRLITSDFFFKNLPEKITTQILPGVYPDRSFRVLVKAAVTGEGVKLDEYRDENKDNFVRMKCTTDVTLASGETHRPSSEYPGGTRYTIYAGSKIPPSHGFGGGKDPWAFLKNGEFECGLRHVDFPREQDATLNFRLVLSEAGKSEQENDTFYADVTFHFFYKWRPAFSSPTFPADAGVAPSDREGQYRWAQKQDAATLESTLSSNAARLFNSGSMSAEKLSSAFADVSVIADRAGRANFPADDKDAANANWSTHKNWAARQDPKGALENLQRRLSAAFASLSRSQKDVFFAEVSVAMAKAEAGGSATDTAAGAEPQNRLLVKPTKSVFGVNETITIDYYNPKGSGWDWVVVVNPNSTAEGKGPFSSIDDRYGKRFDTNDNSLKERNGTFSFDGLPEGEYEVRYVAWYLDGMAGANKMLGPVRFRVGNQVSASPPPGPGPGTNPPPSGNSAKDLTGLWRNPGGNAIYRVRQIGTKVVWGVDATALGSYANVFHGQINANMIDGVWEDLPGSPTIGGGRMLLKVESDCRFTRVNSVNPYGADVWVKKDSTCDSAGLAQRANPSGTKPASTATKPAAAATDKEAANAKPKPAVADNRGRVNPPTAPASKTNKPAPVVEEIPEDNSTKIAANTPAPNSSKKPPVVEEIPETPVTKTTSNVPRKKPPVVEEIPESASPSVASNRPPANPPQVEEIPETSTNNPPATNRTGGNTTNSSGASATNQPKTKPKKEKKPRDPNKPDIWTLLGGAVREAITASPTPGQTQPSTQAPPQTSGCQVGPYSLFALNQPRANEQVWMGFTAPAGRGVGSGDWVGIFRAGETQSSNDRLVLWMYFTSPDCVERFNLPAGEFDAYVFDASSFRATGNRSPVSRGVRLIVNP